MARRKNDKPAQPPLDRSWSARTNVRGRDATRELALYTRLPAETGPTWAPDELSVWPVEGGRFGIDAHYHGPTGAQRAERQVVRLTDAGLDPGVRGRAEGGASIRLGPLAHDAAWLALEAFLGRPVRVAM